MAEFLRIRLSAYHSVLYQLFGPRIGVCSSAGAELLANFFCTSRCRKRGRCARLPWNEGNFPTPPIPPDSTWVSLPIANMNEATSTKSGTCGSGDLRTEYAYAHVYGSSTETGSYKFKKS